MKVETFTCWAQLHATQSQSNVGKLIERQKKAFVSIKLFWVWLSSEGLSCTHSDNVDLLCSIIFCFSVDELAIIITYWNNFDLEQLQTILGTSTFWPTKLKLYHFNQNKILLQKVTFWITKFYYKTLNKIGFCVFPIKLVQWKILLENVNITEKKYKFHFGRKKYFPFSPVWVKINFVLSIKRQPMWLTDNILFVCFLIFTPLIQRSKFEKYLIINLF